MNQCWQGALLCAVCFVAATATASILHMLLFCSVCIRSLFHTGGLIAILPALLVTLMCFKCCVAVLTQHGAPPRVEQ